MFVTVTVVLCNLNLCNVYTANMYAKNTSTFTEYVHSDWKEMYKEDEKTLNEIKNKNKNHG